jgi:ribonuclease HI
VTTRNRDAERDVNSDQIEALKEHFRSSHAGFTPGTGIRPARNVGRIPVATAMMTVLNLHCPGQGQELVITTDGSATTGLDRGTMSGCAAVAWDGRALVGWYQNPPEARGASIYAEWRALVLGLRLAASAPGPVKLMADDRVAVEQLRRMQRGERVQHAFLTCRDEPVLEEMRRLAKNLTFSVGCLEGKRTHNTTAATDAGNAAHRLAFAARRLAECGVDPAGEIAFLEYAAASVSRDKRNLRDLVARRVAAREDGQETSNLT